MGIDNEGDTISRTMSGNLLLGGIPAVGKSTIARGIAAEAPFRYDIVSFGDAILDTIDVRDGLSLDALDEIPAPRWRQLQIDTAERLGAEQTSQPTLYVCHFATDIGSGYIPGVPIEAVDHLTPALLILIRADPEEIEHRRADRARGDRDPPPSTATIARHTDLEYAFATSLVARDTLPMAIVENKDGEEARAVQNVLERIHQL